MLKAVEDIGATKKRLTIEVPPEAIEDEIQEALKRLGERTKLPGFRQGKAPLSLVEKKFGKEVEAEALEKVISRSYSKALEEASLRPVSGPVIEEALKFKRKSPLSMTLTVEVVPKIEHLSYEKIKVKEIPVEVGESDTESTLARLKEEKATYEPTEEALEKGDIAIIDYEVKEDGSSYKDHVFKLGADSMPAGFSEALTGKKKGDRAEVKVKFPEDFRLRQTAGRELTFNVHIKDTKKVNYPAMDDELAKDVGYESLGALKEHIRGEILKAKKEAAANIMKADVLKKIIEAHEFEVPQSLLEREAEELVSGAIASGKAEEKDHERLREELKPAARRNIKASLLIDIIGEKEHIGVTEEEVREKVKALSSRLALSPENVMKYYIAKDGSLEGLRHAIFEDKVLELVLGRAEVEKGDR